MDIHRNILQEKKKNYTHKFMWIYIEIFFRKEKLYVLIYMNIHRNIFQEKKNFFL